VVQVVLPQAVAAAAQAALPQVAAEVAPLGSLQVVELAAS
jgi:hypothetical protein